MNIDELLDEHKHQSSITDEIIAIIDRWLERLQDKTTTCSMRKLYENLPKLLPKEKIPTKNAFETWIRTNRGETWAKVKPRN